MSEHWTSDDVAATDPQGWDLLVVGGGTAGLVAARTAAGFGARVLLVERDRTGGDCLWTGCVPSKAILAAAHASADARTAGRLGVYAQVRVDFPAVMAHVHAAMAAIQPVDSPSSLRGDGVAAARGELRFTGPSTAAVRGTSVRFRQAVVATGSTPVLPDVPGLDQADPLTSDTVWNLTSLPARLLVLGGGSIGCELGQAFARLGSSVTLVEAADRLLGKEDRDASALVHQGLAGDGVDVRVGRSVERVAAADGGWLARLDNGDAIGFDRVLVAVGRRPRTDGLGLDEAGVSLTDKGFVVVDGNLRSANPRVWAAGDVTGHPQFTHTAAVHGSLAASNAVLGLRRSVDLAAVPRVTYTQPEVAAVGLTGHERHGLVVRTTQHHDVDRAVTDDRTAGFTRLVLGRGSRVVGATIVGPRAGESLAELVLAVRKGVRASDLAGTMHAYPTYADGTWKGSVEQVTATLHKPAAALALRLAVRVRRRVLDRSAPPS